MTPDENRTLSVTLHLTHNCNLRCTYCYTGKKYGAGMTEETAERAILFSAEEARRQGAGHLEFVFFGGEPLMKLDLLLWVVDRAHELCNNLRLSFKLSTNGVLLTESAIRELSRREVYVSISIDGAPEIQDTQRLDIYGQGTSGQLEAAIKRLLAWNPCANVTCVCTPFSASKLDESVRWLFEKGFAYITTTLDYSSPWDRHSLGQLRKAYQRLADWYFQKTLDGDRFYLSCFDERIRTWTNGPPGPSERCAIGTRQFSIAPSGRLYPCVQFVREDGDDAMVMGDIHHGFDPVRRKSISCCAEREKPECGGCALLQRCSSWCACVNWQTTGRLDRAGPVVCEHERLLMPIADQLAGRLWKRRNPDFIHKHYNPAFPVLSFAELLVMKEQSNVEEPVA